MDREETGALLSNQFYMKHSGLLQGAGRCAVKLTTLPAEERGEVLLMCFQILEHVEIKPPAGGESGPNVSTWLCADRESRAKWKKRGREALRDSDKHRGKKNTEQEMNLLCGSWLECTSALKAVITLCPTRVGS